MALIPALMAILGLTIFLYPTTASWTTQYHQSKIVNTHQDSIRNVEPDASEQLAKARKFNEALSSGAQLDPHANIACGTGTTTSLLAYEDLLRASDSGLMARIHIPKTSVDLPIYHGTSPETLLRGAGHLQGTSLPVSGPGTRSVITAHRSLADAEMFTYLDNNEQSGTSTLDAFGETLSYRVINKQVTEPTQNEAVAAVPGKDLPRSSPVPLWALTPTAFS